MKFYILGWTVNDVSVWLDFLGLGRFVNVFQMHMIDGEVLMSLTKDELVNDLFFIDQQNLLLFQNGIEQLKEGLNSK